jgi:hypothetical protein
MGLVSLVVLVVGWGFVAHEILQMLNIKLIGTR